MVDQAPQQKIDLIKDTPPHLHDGHFKFILGDEFCFRSSCDGCPYDAHCVREIAPVDVAQEPNVRKAFVSRPGYILAAIDYSGIELRIAANLSKEPVWLNAFLSGADLHAETAKAIFGQNFTKIQRQMAKCVRRGTKVKFRALSTVNEPGSTPVETEVRFVTTPEGKFPLLVESGALVLNPYGKEERKLVRDLIPGDFLVEFRSQRPALKFRRPQQTLGQKKRYLQEGLTLAQVKALKARDQEGLLIRTIEPGTTTLYAREQLQDIDFAHTDTHKAGEFVPFHNVQVWTRGEWQTAAFLYFDGVQDFWTLRVGNKKLQGTGRHLVFAKRAAEEDWIKLEELNPTTDQVLVEEKGQLLWKSFRLDVPEKLTLKAIRRTEEDGRAYKTRDLMFDVVVPVGHEFIANDFVVHNTSNFSNLYGGTAGSLADSANIPMSQARDIWERWWKALPKLKEWYDQVCSAARACGHVKTAFGRRRSLKEWYDGTKQDIAFANRSAVNTVVQGSAADIMKRAMAAIWKYIVDHALQNEVRILLAVHDEIVFEIREKDLQKHLDWILPIMKQTPKGWLVPLEVDCELGYSWGEVKGLEEHKKENTVIAKLLGLVGITDSEPKAPPTTPVVPGTPPEPSAPPPPPPNESGPLSFVVEIPKKIWRRRLVTQVRLALLDSPGDEEVIFDIGGQIFRDPGLPKTNPAKFRKALELITSETS